MVRFERPVNVNPPNPTLRMPKDFAAARSRAAAFSDETPVDIPSCENAITGIRMIERVFITPDRDQLPSDLKQSVEVVAHVKQLVRALSCDQTKLST